MDYQSQKSLSRTIGFSNRVNAIDRLALRRLSLEFQSGRPIRRAWAIQFLFRKGVWAAF